MGPYSCGFQLDPSSKVFMCDAREVPHSCSTILCTVGILEAQATLSRRAAPLMTQPHPASTPINSLTAKKRPAARYAIRVLVLFCVLLVAAQAWSAWSARQSRLAEHAAATSNMASALAAQAESTVRIVDTVLAGVVERVEHDGMASASNERLHSHMRNMVLQVQELHGLFVYGADGSCPRSTVRSSAIIPTANISNTT